MGDLTRDSDRMLSDGRALLRDNREGGRFRRTPSIGRGSAEFKSDHFRRKLKRILITTAAIFAGAMATGIAIDGIGLAGVMITLLMLGVAIAFLASFPRIKVPRREDLNRGEVQQMVARTELWLESQTPALPPPAARIVEDMGVQLDALGLQLQGLDPRHPKAREVRSLIGEQLPEMIDSYRRIPPQMRKEQRAGSSPDEQLTNSLRTISGEIDSITRQLAEGSLDDLAIKHRFLDTKFGSGADVAPQLEHKP